METPDLGRAGERKTLFIEYQWSDNEDAHRLECWLKGHFEAHRLQENSEIVTGVTEEQLRLAWNQGIRVISASEETA